MATLTVSQTKNYQRVLLSSIETITFTNQFVSSATATFSSSQFDDVRIMHDVAINGSGGTNRISVIGGSFDASAWTFAGWSVNDRVIITGGITDDTLTGSTQRDTVLGGEGADIIAGGLGADLLQGDLGNDTIVYDQATEIASGEIVDGGDGVADKLLLDHFQTYDFRQVQISNVERLEFVTAGTARLLSAMVGPAAIATIRGEVGQNWVWIDGSATDLSNVTFNNWETGIDRITLMGDSGIANILVGSAREDNISGRELGDILSGNAGADRITGGAAADQMAGGTGNDTFHLVNAADMAAGETINGGSGPADTLLLGHNNGTYQLGLGTILSVEALQFSDNGNTASITGALFAAAGFTTIRGGLGTALLKISGSVDLSGVTMDLWTAGDTVSVTGDGLLGDTIAGTSAADVISSLGGNDTVAGGGGGDNLNGGDGFDTLSYAGSAGAVTVDLGLNTAVGGDAAGDTIFSFENVTGGNGNDTLTGSSDVNVIDGGNGNDILFGGGGADSMLGGAGTDTIEYNSFAELPAAETIDGGSGTFDKLVLRDADATTYDLTSVSIGNIERITLSDGGSAVMNGSAFGASPGKINTILGTANDEHFELHGQVIDLSGVTLSNWTNPLFFLTPGDSIFLIGGGTDDNFTGSSGSDVLYGLFGSDTLKGGAGSDMLFGSAGQDFMTGGADGDWFYYQSTQESAVGASRDRIEDFDQGSDMINLEMIDAIAGGNDDDFVFINQSNFTNGVAGRLRYFFTAGGNTVVEGETNGDSQADFQIQLTGQINLASADFML